MFGMTGMAVVLQVVLEDQDSHEVLRFDFSRWVGQVGGDIQHELPVLVPGQQAPAGLSHTHSIIPS